MASRYGRNKKRRHRARISELEALLRAEKQRGDVLERSLKDLAAKLDLVLTNVKGAVPHSVVLPPVPLKHDPYEWAAEAYREPLRLSSFMDDLHVPFEVRDLLRVRLGTVRVFVQTAIEDPGFRTAVHFHVPGPDGTRHYKLAVPQGDLRCPSVVEQIIDQAIRAFQVYYEDKNKESA